MIDKYRDIIEEARVEESKGNLNNALTILSNALNQNNGNSIELVYESGMMLYRSRQYSKAIKLLIRCHSEEYYKDEVEQLIYYKYFIPKRDYFKRQYEKNKSSLQNYKYFSYSRFPEFDSLQYYFIRTSSDAELILFDRINKVFFELPNLKSSLKDSIAKLSVGNVLVFKNLYDSALIAQIQEVIKPEKQLLTMKIPFYLHYSDVELFFGCMQVYDYSECLKNDNIVFLMGLEEVEQCFSDEQAILPDYVLGKSDNIVEDPLYKKIKEINEYRYEYIEHTYLNLKDYYKSNNIYCIMENLRKGKPKILFLTSRFTTFLQYCIRDCALACEKQGIPYKISIEKSDIHRTNIYSILKNVWEFKPDIIFSIDHFRWEHSYVTDGPIYISWIQDPMPHIFDKCNVEKLRELDFILNWFVTSKEFLELGYPTEKLIDAPVPVNHDIFKKYSLSDEEKEKYSCDLCCVTHGGNPYLAFDNIIKDAINIDMGDKFYKAMKDSFDEIYALTRKWIRTYSNDFYYRILERNLYNQDITLNNMDSFAYKLRYEIGSTIQRSVPLEWLHEKGYDMKLWGNGWSQHPILSQYAMGSANNGEMLSKIYNCSKIVIGLSPQVSMHPRVLEANLSNSLSLGNSMPEEHDWANIRMFMEENKEFILFYDKDDLYRKVDYYLENEEKRKQVINYGISKVLSNYTYDAMIKRMLNEILHRLEQKYK